MYVLVHYVAKPFPVNKPRRGHRVGKSERVWIRASLTIVSWCGVGYAAGRCGACPPKAGKRFSSVQPSAIGRPQETSLSSCSHSNAAGILLGAGRKRINSEQPPFRVSTLGPQYS